MPNPTCVIAGVDRSDKTKVNSVSITRTISNRSTLSCGLMERAGVYRPVPGNVIEIEQGSPAVKRFAGYIEDIEEQAVPGNMGAIEYRVTAVDYTRLLDWRVYSGSFENVSFYSIVSTIISAKFTTDDGISLAGVVNPGPTITTRIQDGLRPITEWFRKLATETGYNFRIDEDKVLQFGPLSTSPPNPAPFSLTFGSLNWRDLKIRRRMGDYRNRQYVRTEYTVSGTLTMQFTGDGATRDFFQFDGSFQGAPTATVDTGGGPVAVTVGRLGYDALGLFDWYYDVEGWGFHNFAPDPALGVGDILEITYRVRFNNISVAQDSAEITARGAIQGDSGVIEAINEDRYIDTKAALDARAVNLLRQRGSIPIEVEFATDSRVEPLSDGLEPGMLLDVDLTDGPSGVNDSFLVESVESQWIAGAESDIWQHRIGCTNLEPNGATPSAREPVVAVMEKLVEAIRIGPDPETILSESPAAATDFRDWPATIVDDAAPLVTGTDLSNHRPVDCAEGEAVELIEWFAVLEVAPVSSFVFDILRSSDDGSSWVSIFGASKPTFTAGQKRIDGTAFNIGTLYRDERLRYDALTADGTASILTVVLNGRKVPDTSPA